MKAATRLWQTNNSVLPRKNVVLARLNQQFELGRQGFSTR